MPPAPFVLAVLALKGGVGKTTLATNLAAAAHLAGKRTMILDLDKQGSAFDWACAREDGGRLDGLNVLRADKALSPAKFAVATAGQEVVILDGPPRLGDLTRSAAVAADVVLVPLRAGAFDVWTVAPSLELLDAADEIRAELSRPPVRRVLVLNGAAPRSRANGYALDAIHAAAEVGPTIGNRVDFALAAADGGSVLLAPESPASAEVMALWAFVTSTAPWATVTP